MLTDQFYRHLASLLKGQQIESDLYIALGSGSSDWDQSLPVYERATNGLQNEIFRKRLELEDITFIDDEGNPSEEATTRLQLSANFFAGEGEGTIREAGLIVGTATENLNSGSLISYYMHPRIEKGDALSLNRRFLISLAPGESSGSQFVTRYLGNSNSQELHDLDNQKVSCQIDEIRFDRVIYFASLEQAQNLGYDACAHCFGRELSER